MAANAKPHRKLLKSETLKIKKKYKDVPEKKEHHKDFEKFAKERYKSDQKLHEHEKKTPGSREKRLVEQKMDRKTEKQKAYAHMRKHGG